MKDHSTAGWNVATNLYDYLNLLLSISLKPKLHYFNLLWICCTAFWTTYFHNNIIISSQSLINQQKDHNAICTAVSHHYITAPP